jgi:hypothetical protein
MRDEEEMREIEGRAAEEHMRRKAFGQQQQQQEQQQTQQQLAEMRGEDGFPWSVVVVFVWGWILTKSAWNP